MANTKIKEEPRTCTKCGGSGKTGYHVGLTFVKEKCENCNGKGKVLVKIEVV